MSNFQFLQAEFKPLFVAHSTAELHAWLIEHA